MKAVILAAGRGKRMNELTENIPKTLLQIHSKPIILHTLSSLPSDINDVIIVVKYLGDMIRDEIGDKFKHLKVSYVDQSQSGTGGALWSAKKYLGDEPFLVLNADDLYDSDDLKNLISFPLSFGLSSSLPPNDKFLSIEMDEEKYISGSHKVGDDLDKPTLLATGAYVLDKSIFTYEPVLLKNGELGLPQTILLLAKDKKVKGVIMKHWLPINNKEELQKAQQYLKNKLE